LKGRISEYEGRIEEIMKELRGKESDYAINLKEM